MGKRWLALCAAGALLSATSAPAADALVTAYATLPQIDEPVLSPDGTRFASLVASGGRQLLAVMSLTDTTATPAAVDVGARNDLVIWHWVNDEWLVATLSSTNSVQGSSWRISRAFGVRAKDGKLVPLARERAAQNGADILWIARDGTPRILLAVQQSIYSDEEEFYPEVFEIDVSTGRMVSRARPTNGVMDWYADSEGNVRIGVGYNERQRSARLYYRERNGVLFRTVDRANFKDGESLTVPVAFLPEAGKALAFSSHTGFTALYELDLQTLALGREVFSVPGYDVSSVRLDPTGRELIGVNYTDTRPRTRWLEPLMSKAQRDLDKAFAPAHVTIVSTDRNQRRMIALAATAGSPGSYFLVDLDKGGVTLLAHVNAAVDALPRPATRSLRYKSRDGMEIEAVLTLPPGREATRLPLIVMPHGGPTARDDESFDWWAQYLAQLGYAVIQPNFRGSSGYGNEHRNAEAGQWGLAMQDDLLDAIDHLAKQGIADSARTCIVGGSYGGYAALRAAQRDASHYRCAVSFAGISDIVSMVQFDARMFLGATARDSMKESAPDFRLVSPINFVAEFATPLLMLHGVKDLVVEVRQSRELHEKLTKAGKSVRYVEMPAADHYLRRTEDRLTFLEELTTFLKAHNPPR